MKWFKRIVLILFIAIVTVAIVVIADGYGLYKDVLEEVSLENKVKEVRKDEDFVSLTSLPTKYQQAVIAVEDHRFKEHGAIDLIAIGRAIWVNIIHFEDGYYGIKQACNGYLDKEPQNMTLYEATMMAGIPNAPSVYAPTVNPDLTKSRQQKVINSMVEYGYLTQEEAEKIHE